MRDISKRIYRWSYKLPDDVEEQDETQKEELTEDPEILSRKGKRMEIYTKGNNI